MGMKFRRSILFLMLSIMITLGIQYPICVSAENGTINYYDEDVYVGNYTEGEIKNGYGVYYCADGTQITGSWKDNYLTGKATVVYPNKDLYWGLFKKDKRNGSGTYKFANGDVYSGKWKDDLMHGKGKYTWKNKAYVSGTWKNGKLNGNAVLKKGKYKYTINVKNGVLKKVIKRKKV